MKYFLILLIATTVSNFGSAQVQNYEKINQEWKTDLSKHSVELSELKALMKRDGIPPIDNPKYISTKEAKTVYFEHEPVIVIENGGKAKAIPLNILTYH